MGRVPTVDVGVLGVVPTDPEVIAVFPELSSTVLPHAQEIRFFRGDSLDIGIQVQDDRDPADPVSLSNCLLRFAAKQGHGGVPSSLRNKVVLGNEAAMVLKSSSDSDQIEIVSEVSGQAIVHLYREDTHLLPTGSAVWDLELVRPREAVTLPAGNVLFTSGADVVLSTIPSLDWTTLGLRSGDLFLAQGRTAVVAAVLSSQHLQLDWADWTSAVVPTSEISVYRARTKTVAYGAFVVLGDVTR